MGQESIAKWIETLNLEEHPEGGYYSEAFRDQQVRDFEGLGKRNVSTSIYFLLTSDTFSAFHRIKSDEVWHFYDGDPLLIHWFDEAGRLQTEQLGLDPDKGYLPQVVIPKNSWFASEVKDGGKYSLVGCTVAPGFDFQDFELAKSDELVRQFPTYLKVIDRLTRD